MVHNSISEATTKISFLTIIAHVKSLELKNACFIQIDSWSTWYRRKKKVIFFLVNKKEILRV